MRRHQVVGPPTVMLFDANGRLVDSRAGELSQASPQQLLVTPSFP